MNSKIEKLAALGFVAAASLSFACEYAPPPTTYEYELKGRVVNVDNEALRDIQITYKDIVKFSKQDGSFLFSSNEDGVILTEEEAKEGLSLKFSDIDGPANKGEYYEMSLHLSTKEANNVQCGYYCTRQVHDLGSVTMIKSEPGDEE
ncbi:MAG: hypothetical protein WC966_06610 [Bradymonadales bacterium]